jgi:hypothetical protein
MPIVQGLRSPFAERNPTLGLFIEQGVILMDPAVDADLVTLGDNPPRLVRVYLRADGRHEETRLYRTV